MQWQMEEICRQSANRVPCGQPTCSYVLLCMTKLATLMLNMIVHSRQT